MKILVTGADGFVGKALSEYLLGKGEVIKGSVIDGNKDVADGVAPVISGNIGSKTDWSDALCGIEYVIHTAARVHVMEDQSSDPLTEYRKVNVEGTKKLAEQAAAEGVKRFVFISSIKVNGEETSIGKPFRESDIPSPVDPYGVSKLEAEKCLHEIGARTGMEVVIVRPPLVYGPGVKANFRKMIGWVKKGIPLPLGAINNKRSFIALDNFVDFLYCCLEHAKAANRVFLISDNYDLSTTELLKKIAISFDIKSILLPVPVVILISMGNILRKKSVVSRLVDNLQVDSSQAMELLGWKPMVSVDEALKKVAVSYANEKVI